VTLQGHPWGVAENSFLVETQRSSLEPIAQKPEDLQ
jgi:hypothetical protein